MCRKPNHLRDGSSELRSRVLDVYGGGMENRVADFYQRFAELEAHGSSAVYEEWTAAIAKDPEVVALIEQLPGMKSQPNLVFAAARLLGAPVGPYSPLRGWLLSHWDEVVPIVMSGMTQTNEAGRCAVLLPLLARIPDPIALIEVGASSGLCLYPDRYSYRYDTPARVIALDPDDGPSSVVLPCRISGEDVPDRLPEVVWRAGVDLNPLDVRNAGDVDWLETLVWPEHTERRARLRAAVDLVALNPPKLVRGDLVDKVQQLIAAAPGDATVVVFHSAVLVYLDPDRRAEFVELMGSHKDIEWISNEGERVIPSVFAQLPRSSAGRTVVAHNGTAVAFVDPHGQSYERL